MISFSDVLPVRTRSFNITIEGLMAFRYEVFQLIGLASTSNRLVSFDLQISPVQTEP
jgi:hypothetical protein